MKKKIIAFMNAYTQGNSGGDACFIEIVKRFSEYEKVIITSSLGESLCSGKGLDAEYLITTRETDFSKVILTYVMRTLKALFLNLKVEKTDILYATSDFLPDVLPVWVKKIFFRKGKWVQKIYHLIPKARRVPYIAQRLSFIFIKNAADIIIVDNELLRKDLISFGFSSEKIKVNHLGIDLKYFKEIPKDGEFGYDGVFIGRMHPSKGIFDLIEIMEHVCCKNPDFRLAVIGGGNKKYAEELQQKITMHNLDKNITMLGYLEDAKAYKILKNSKIFVFPSHEEGFGIAAAEAMACGLPVVAWNLPVFDEVFPRGMIKLEMGDLKSFADVLIKFNRDREFYEDISGKAWGLIQSYDWENVSKREKALFI